MPVHQPRVGPALPARPRVPVLAALEAEEELAVTLESPPKRTPREWPTPQTPQTPPGRKAPRAPLPRTPPRVAKPGSPSQASLESWECVELELDEKLKLLDLTQELNSLEQCFDAFQQQGSQALHSIMQEVQELHASAAQALEQQVDSSQLCFAVQAASALQASHWAAAGAEAAARKFQKLAADAADAAPLEVAIIPAEPALSGGWPLSVRDDEALLGELVQGPIMEVARSFPGQSAWPKQLEAKVELRLFQEVGSIRELLKEERRQRRGRHDELLQAASLVLKEIGGLRLI
ncbi:unnamed protein product [Effrenium voratum]|nr:unnamed protein product [Effrenium voratum]